MNPNETPIACRMDALAPEERARRAELFTRLAASIHEIRELPDGFELALSPAPDIWMIAAEFITLEARCCPFLAFSLQVEVEDGPMSLSITGRSGVKEFLATELRFGRKKLDALPK